MRHLRLLLVSGRVVTSSGTMHHLLVVHRDGFAPPVALRALGKQWQTLQLNQKETTTLGKTVQTPQGFEAAQAAQAALTPAPESVA